MRATLDANVIISAFYSSGIPRHILEMARSGRIKLFISQPILDEVCEVLQRDKFGWSKADVNYATSRLMKTATLVDPQMTINVVTADSDDDAILECAVASRSDYLVTGDRHLLKVKQYDGVRIIKPADFFAMVQQRGL